MAGELLDALWFEADMLGKQPAEPKAIERELSKPFQASWNIFNQEAKTFKPYSEDLAAAMITNMLTTLVAD